MTTPTIETKRVPTVPDEDGWFSAVVYRVNAPPDADGDVILAGAIEDGTEVVVSANAHDVLTDGAEPAGEATLYHAKDGVVAIGRAFSTERGRLLRRKVRESNVEWSVGFRVLSSRPPTREERARHPATRRIVLAWRVSEISPVAAGSCGPACTTLVSKAATCGGPCCDANEAALRELARFERTRARLTEAKFLLAKATAERDARAKRFAAGDRDREVLEAHELSRSQVSPLLRDAAAEAVDLATEILGGNPPRVRWYAPAAIADLGATGITYRGEGEIWVSAREDDEPGVFGTTAHEVLHSLRPGAGEAEAAHFGLALTLLRGRELHVGALHDFEPRVVDERAAAPPYLAASPRRVWTGGAAAGTLVVSRGVLFERGENAWREVGRLAAA